MCWFSNLCVKILCKMFQFLANKSYYHRFIAINLTKTSWRTLWNMIFSVTNPTDFVDWFETIHKMWSCSFWTQPQKVVGYHRETHHFREEKSTKEFTAPQHTRFILPLTSPDKIIAALRGWYFSFTGNAPWKFHEPTGRDTDFSSTPLHKQGQELRSEQTVIPIHEQKPSTYFLHLNNSATITRKRFWAQR